MATEYQEEVEHAIAGLAKRADPESYLEGCSPAVREALLERSEELGMSYDREGEGVQLRGMANAARASAETWRRSALRAEDGVTRAHREIVVAALNALAEAFEEMTEIEPPPFTPQLKATLSRRDRRRREEGDENRRATVVKRLIRAAEIRAKARPPKLPPCGARSRLRAPRSRTSHTSRRRIGGSRSGKSPPRGEDEPPGAGSAPHHRRADVRDHVDRSLAPLGVVT